MQYYSDIKRNKIWVNWTEADEPRACYIKSEEEKQISYTNVCIWNLEKWYQWTYFQGENRVMGVQNRLVDTAGEGECVMSWESSIETYITVC